MSIRPGVRVLSVLRHLNYKPWFALAEFVDNSLQSYLDHRQALRAVEGKSFRHQVSIRIEADEGGRITIRDNAAGIRTSARSRAFESPDPPDSSGLSEFGMGMKSAACWFAPTWVVRTKALGESVEKTVAFDIKRILKDSLEELDIQVRNADPRKHYTEIILGIFTPTPLNGVPLGDREQPAGTNRMFNARWTRSGFIMKRGSNESDDEAPTILNVPYHKTPTGKPVTWKKDLDFCGWIRPARDGLCRAERNRQHVEGRVCPLQTSQADSRKCR